MRISRRHFLGAAALAGAAPGSVWGSGNLPKRPLGRTGAKVSILGFGGGSGFVGLGEEQAIQCLNRALDLGIDYVDTAATYGNGVSELRIGGVAKTRRSEMFLATKIEDRDGSKALRAIEAGLRRLQTDRVDLLQIHALGDASDLAAIQSPDGVLRVLYKLRDEKVARAIGIAGHSNPVALAQAIERHDFDCAAMSLNAALAGVAGGPEEKGPASRGPATFQSVALPVARRKGIGVIAMNVFAQGRLIGPAAPEMLLRYALSLPVSTVVAGMAVREHMEADVDAARSFTPLSSTEMDNYADRVSSAGQAELGRDRL